MPLDWISNWFQRWQPGYRISVRTLQVGSLEVGSAATAAGRVRELRSQHLVRSRHRLTQQRSGINDRYRQGCNHPAWLVTG
jgi:hypothetical protein